MIFSVKIFSTALTHIVEYLALFSNTIFDDAHIKYIQR